MNQIFHEFINGYSHWAYGDNDLIWGRWSNMLPVDWEKYDKIGDFGHLTIIRNSDEMNHLYRYSDAYKIAFKDTRNLFFDELGFNQIVNRTKKKTIHLKIADCNPRVRKITPITPLENKCSGVFMWDNGHLFHVYEEGRIIKREEIAYIHFLKRKMSASCMEEDKCNSFMIRNILIEPVNNEEEIRYAIQKERKSQFYIEYWKKYLSLRQIIKTIRAKINPTRPVTERIRIHILSYKDS